MHAVIVGERACPNRPNILDAGLVTTTGTVASALSAAAALYIVWQYDKAAYVPPPLA